MVTRGPVLTRPRRGRSSPSNALSKLVFPEPLGPTIAIRSPAVTVKAGTLSLQTDASNGRIALKRGSRGPAGPGYTGPGATPLKERSAGVGGRHPDAGLWAAG